jgi:hypothetical protein
MAHAKYRGKSGHWDTEFGNRVFGNFPKRIPSKIAFFGSFIVVQLTAILSIIQMPPFENGIKMPKRLLLKFAIDFRRNNVICGRIYSFTNKQYSFSL